MQPCLSTEQLSIIVFVSETFNILLTNFYYKRQNVRVLLTNK